jgi:hypothetical protein
MNEEIDIEEFAPWLALIITLVGGFLRILLLSAKGMWLDETFSVWMASHSVADMLEWTIKIDQHPPLYYLLLHYWMDNKGNTPYDVRLLSVLFGAGTIPIVYLIGKRISGVVMGLAAAALLALSPFHIYFAQEARMYTLLTFNAAAAIYALVRLLTDPRAAQPIGRQLRDFLLARDAPQSADSAPKAEFTYKDERFAPTGWRARLIPGRWPSLHALETDLAWIAFIIFSAATLLTHNTAVLFLLAVNIFILGLMWSRRTKTPNAQHNFHAPSFGNWAKAQVGILLLWSPWIAPFFKQASVVYQRFWIPAPTWEVVTQVLKAFLNASAPLPAAEATAIWTVYILTLCLGLVHFRKKFSQFAFLAALFFIPFLGELAVSAIRPIFFARTLIWITIPLYLALAAGIAQLKLRPLILVAVVSFGAINLLSVADYYRSYQKEDWNTPAGYIANFAEKDDLVLFNSNFVEIAFNYYFQTYEDLYNIQVDKQGVPFDLFADGILEPEMTANDIPRLLSLLRGHKRVWLVYSHESYTDPLGLIPQTLASQMKLTRTREFYGGVVQLYEMP